METLICFQESCSGVLCEYETLVEFPAEPDMPSHFFQTSFSTFATFLRTKNSRQTQNMTWSIFLHISNFAVWGGTNDLKQKTLRPQKQLFCSKLFLG